ncbi:serine/threonine-protein kinase 16 isoform X1 [Pteropus medius]|uniref:non-specific serine/threonine protein kinase n=2 Tax=Pteropus vampyrus TaxID=132908 RepID=A0A6P6CE01_PTEVA|nr:serine/threonine-protein kinase 16 isoform X1 [Pteropus vampyrus]XP_023385514.1 serine/threonine-protein kinase 16 isoform X1 [Pteropus vampyrus]XP_023385515.1 serine/threonine-protein kinase 16 isoform X1 [Pteropus vampyrus]XP_039700774.1 serine/threonine-protein kinase 16 isoform X1 [Pteropus giganteus]XP_039700775.1 serine/threonine-protein kinase 16 isoform X1 [Pteropus giganteus]XP_039700776.1 serine/threonine-protein kinase 16 isoform X1 [Pteropus giganteus]
MGHALCVCSRGTVIIDNKRYLFIQKLGEGGFSYVDLVEGLHDGHFYALKRILCHEQQDREEAQREADMHRLFHHPNILHLVAYCLRERGTKHEAWLLLPFFKRGTLWNEIERLKDKGNFLTEEQILQLLLGICRGLEAIHAQGYAHRSVGGPCVLLGAERKSPTKRNERSLLSSQGDLKPTNILLGDGGQPVLMDLGSMNQACIHVENSRQALALQDWAAQRCTISYRAPELFSVQSHCVIDERTDVWSLGCVLYAMMFGEGPYDMVFQKGDSVALAVQNQLSIPQSPRHSSAMRQLLASMMTVDPQQRPHIPLILSQLEALQPPAPGQHTTQI